jgi:hypothetical protein
MVRRLLQAFYHSSRAGAVINIGIRKESKRPNFGIRVRAR